MVDELPSSTASGSLRPGTRAWLLSREASHVEVIDAIMHATHVLPPGALAWRCRASREFFEELTWHLRGAGVYSDEIWRFGFFWKHPQCISEWLAANKAVVLRHVGVPLYCEFLRVRSLCCVLCAVCCVIHAGNSGQCALELPGVVRITCGEIS